MYWLLVPSAERWQPQAGGVCGYYNRRVRLAKASLRDLRRHNFSPTGSHCVQTTSLKRDAPGLRPLENAGQR